MLSFLSFVSYIDIDIIKIMQKKKYIYDIIRRCKCIHVVVFLILRSFDELNSGNSLRTHVFIRYEFDLYQLDQSLLAINNTGTKYMYNYLE